MFALRRSGASRPAVSSRPFSASRRLRELQGPFATLTAVAALLVFERPVVAGPAGGQVVGGSATISQSGSTTNVNQSSQAAIINWQSFSIAPKETVNFNQPNTSSVALNRVIGNEKSIIAGALNANGRVFIVNSAGVLFSKSAQVNVGGLVASTLNISNADFMAGNYRFTGTSGASVINRGHINAGPGGYVALLGRTVVNDGVISARLGTVAMASGEQMTLNFGGDSLVDVTIDKGTMNALVANHRLIKADGGQVIMTAKAADEVLSAQVNNTGVVQARTIAALTGGGTARTGKIKILASGGTANIAGRLDASAPKGGNGGSIETSGDKVKIADTAVITTKASNGQTGTWLIDPDGFNIGGLIADISGAQLSQRLASNNITIASTQGHGADGNINVEEAVTWGAGTTLTLNATNAINVNAVIAAPNGGLALNAGTDVNINKPSSVQVATLNATALGNVNLNAPQTWTNAGNWTFNGTNINVNDTVNWSAGTLTFNAGFSNGTPGINPGFINLNAVMTASGTASFVANYNTNMDISTTTVQGFTMPSPTYGTQFGGINPLFDPAAGTFVGRIDFVNNTAANPLTINGTSYTLITSIGQPTLPGGAQNPHDLSVIDANGDVGNYALAANLDARLIPYTDSPIANSNTSGFSGTLEGLGHTISNLTINASGVAPLGLIGQMFGGTVRDIGIRNIQISDPGGGDVGALVGLNFGGFVINSFAAGAGSSLNPIIVSIPGADPNLNPVLKVQNPGTPGAAISGDSQVGGLVGLNAGLIVNSHADVSVYGVNNTGGLVGWNLFNDTSSQAVILNSYATGAVYAGRGGNAADDGAGGFVGRNSGGVISNSYATGAVKALDVETVGGFAGINEDNFPTFIGTLTNVASYGSVFLNWTNDTAPGHPGLGGLVGYNINQINGGFTSSPVTEVSSSPSGFGFAQSISTGTVVGSQGSGNAAGTGIADGVTFTNTVTCNRCLPGQNAPGGPFNNPNPSNPGSFPGPGSPPGLSQAAAARANAQALTQQAGLQQAAAQGNVINAANVSANISTAMTASTGANPGAASAGTGATGSTGGSIVDSNIQYEGTQTTGEHRHHRTASNRQNNRGNNFGATIRTIEINGRPFRLRGGRSNSNTTPPGNGNSTTQP